MKIFMKISMKSYMKSSTKSYMKLLLLTLFFATQVQANESISLENSWNLFKQKLGPDFSLPEPLNARTKLAIQFEIPSAAGGAALKKVFSQVTTVNEFKTEVEIYYFDQNSQRYLSQQVFLYKEEKLITRCTAYFGLEQKFLVPGSCAGVEDEILYGIAIYK